MGNLTSRLGTLAKTAWGVTKDNIKSKRYLQNYPNDLLAGLTSRMPPYAIFDNTFLKVPDENVISSMVNATVAAAAGWSLIYALGNSLLSTGLGEFYQKHAKKIDAIYSSVMTFGFGMGVTLAADYEIGDALASSATRMLFALPLGPVTRYYTDSFRQARNEPKIAKETQFKDKSWKYKLPRLAAMVAIPLALAGATLHLTPERAEEYQKQEEITLQVPIKKESLEFVLNSE